MLKYLFVDNYKSLVNFKIEFDGKNVLLGKNGAGKSTLFAVLYMLQSFLSGEEKIESLLPATTLTRWQSVGIQTFEFCLETEKGNFTYRLEIEQSAQLRKSRVKSEKVFLDAPWKPLFESGLGKAILYNDSFEQGPEILTDWLFSGVSMVQERRDNTLLTFFKKEVKKIIVCSPLPFAMRTIAETETPLLDIHCSNIADVYRYMLLSHTNLVSDYLLSELRNINPALQSISFTENTEIKRLRYTMDYKGKESDYLFSELSDGERMLFLLYLIAGCYIRLGYMVFIDEPDNWLSLKEIQPWLTAVEDTLAETNGQCIIISHHPEVMDFWAAENGRWLSRLEYGATRLVESYKVEKPISYSQAVKQGIIDDAE